MAEPKDPIAYAITRVLKPWASNHGLRKVSGRIFSRLSGEVLQSVVVDANGFGGRERVYVIYSVNPVFLGFTAQVIGGRLGNEFGDIAFDMSSSESAMDAMEIVVALLDKHALPVFEKYQSLSSVYEAAKEDNRVSYIAVIELWNGIRDEFKGRDRSFYEVAAAESISKLQGPNHSLQGRRP